VNRIGWLVIVLVLAAACTGDDADDADNPLEGTHHELRDRETFWFWAPEDPLAIDWEGPPDAEVLAGGGDVQPDDAARDGDALDDLDLQSAARVQADAEGNLWVLSVGTLFRIGDGSVDRAYDTGDANAMAVSPRGPVAASDRSDVSIFESAEGPSERLSTEFVVDSLAFTVDGTLLAGAAEHLWVKAFEGDAGEPPQDVLTPPSAREDGRVAHLTALTDGRVAFATREVQEGTFALRLVVDGQAQPVGDDPERALRQDVSSIAAAPDARLLVTTSEAIEAVDVDTGESETLVELDGAEGTFSAAAVDDDLVFLADGRLWRLPQAFR
jgi:hypothetical protein